MLPINLDDDKYRKPERSTFLKCKPHENAGVCFLRGQFYKCKWIMTFKK